MPTQIRRPSAQTLARTAPDVSSDNLTPLTIIAILVFVLHLAGAAMLGHSQASLAMAPSMSAEAGCAGEPSKKERPLPYD
jgi:hypothetical protein